MIACGLIAAALQSADAATWSYGGKIGIGTAHAPKSLVWFSLAEGMVTETMFGMIHQIRLKDLQFSVDGMAEGPGLDNQIAYLDSDAAGRPQSLAFRQTGRDKQGRFEIEKQIFTDPESNSLFLRVTFRVKAASEAGLILHPALDGKFGGESVVFTEDALHLEKAGTHLVVRSSRPLGKIAQGETVVDFALGFGDSRQSAEQAADFSLKRGYARVLDEFEAGWHGYLAKLSALPALAAEAGDGGKLAYASAMVLKAHEDKLHPGALVASLSTPWGDSMAGNEANSGYRAIWPRDFYQCAMALLALGDRETPLAALRYLQSIQIHPAGWFPQKTHVDGEVEWVGVQLDQTAMPIMLAWKLSQAGTLDDQALAALYGAMLKPAASFLADGGRVDLQWNHTVIKPPFTQQERWEEQPGLSPSTTAATIAGLIAAAEIADRLGDKSTAAHSRKAADRFSAGIERGMATAAKPHFLRIAPLGRPDHHDLLQPRNGKPALPEEQVFDAGFLELVRYGVRPADDAVITASLAYIDDLTLPDEFRLKYEFHFPGTAEVIPGWRRYGSDGYGEDTANGANYAAQNGDLAMSPTQRGRVWPIFTGERGHYQLALLLRQPKTASDEGIAAIKRVYLHGMELFANAGLMLPEQVWDGVGADPEGRHKAGAGTGSATPLAWAHAEYIKLLRSLHDRAVWDNYPPVAARYGQTSKLNDKKGRHHENH